MLLTVFARLFQKAVGGGATPSAVVRLNFTDGSFRLISDAGYWEAYDTQGNYVSKDHYYGDDDDWYAFLKPYLPSPTDGKPSVPSTSNPKTDTE